MLQAPGAVLPARASDHAACAAVSPLQRLRRWPPAAAASSRGIASARKSKARRTGSGRGSWLDLVVLKSLRAGKLVYPGPLDRAHAWAYLPDLARAFVAVAERARPGQAAGLSAFEVLHFEGHTLTGAELLAALAGAADDIGATPAVVARRGWRHGSLPWGLMRAAGIFVPMLKAVAEMRYLWFQPHALDGASLWSCTGALPQTPPRQALRQALLDLGFAAQARPDHTRAA